MKILRWEIEQGAIAKNTLKFKLLFESVDEDSIKFKSREMSHADLIVELRSLLRLFAKHRPGVKLVICIDELDKLDRVKDLGSIINKLKDLFHVQGVHFVVAVSTEALASFVKRGLPSRDAFDSSFDVIVQSRWLTATESLKVISSRSAGFAPLVSLFCYAWSGGLARDLLRAARKCVENQRSDTSGPLSLPELVRRLVLEDLTAAVGGFYENGGLTDEDANSTWQILRELESAKVRLTDSFIVDAGNVVDALIFKSDELEALRCKVILGLHLVELAQGVSKFANYWDIQSAAMRQLEAILTDFALAIGALGGPPQRRTEFMQRAMRRFDSSSLQGQGGKVDLASDRQHLQATSDRAGSPAVTGDASHAQGMPGFLP
jgi:hypothetical protein